MLRHLCITPQLLGLLIAALFIAANTTESESPASDYEASEYTHFGCPWTAVITGTPAVPDSRWTWESVTVNDCGMERNALLINANGPECILIWSSLLKNLLFGLALQTPILLWFWARRQDSHLNRISIQTALLMMLVAGLLLGVNISKHTCGYYGEPAFAGHVEGFCRGWPCHFQREWLNHFSGDSSAEVEKFGSAIDAMVAISMLWSMAIVSEALARRTDRVPTVSQNKQSSKRIYETK